MTFLRNAVLSLAAFGFLAAVPLTAHALEVECELRDGSSCTVSNDDGDFISCACEDGSGTAGTGSDDWADFDEEQLMEVCLAETVQCSAGGTDGGTTGMATTTGATSGGDTEGGTAGSTGSSTGYGGETTGGSDTGTSSSTGGGSGPSTTPSDTDSNGTAPGGDSGPGSTTGAEPGSESGEDGSSGGGGGDSEDPSGCSVDSRDKSGGILFAMFGLALGLRSRRRR